jgi:hypothetical protein
MKIDSSYEQTIRHANDSLLSGQGGCEPAFSGSARNPFAWLIPSAASGEVQRAVARSAGAALSRPNCSV